MKVELGEKFIKLLSIPGTILRDRCVDFFLDTMLSFVLIGVQASVRLFSSGSFAVSITNPGYLEAAHGLLDDACSHGSSKKDAIAFVFHIVAVSTEPDFTQEMAEVTMIIGWYETYSILKQWKIRRNFAALHTSVFFHILLQNMNSPPKEL